MTEFKDLKFTAEDVKEAFQQGVQHGMSEAAAFEWGSFSGYSERDALLSVFEDLIDFEKDSTYAEQQQFLGKLLERLDRCEEVEKIKAFLNKVSKRS